MNVFEAVSLAKQAVAELSKIRKLLEQLLEAQQR